MASAHPKNQPHSMDEDRCGAPTATTGKPCQRRPLEGAKHCRLHKGKRRPMPKPPVPRQRRAPPADGLCGAKTSRGTSCRSPVIRGATRCRLHGGAHPNSLDAARRRLLAAADPAAVALIDIATNDRVVTRTKTGRGGEKVEVSDVEVSPGARVRAAEAILDRAGIPRRQQLEHMGDVGFTVSIVDPLALPKPKEEDKEGE